MQASDAGWTTYANCGLRSHTETPTLNAAPASPAASQSSLLSELASMLDAGAHETGEVDATRLPMPGEAAPLILIEEHNSDTRLLLKTECYPGGSLRVIAKQVDVSGNPVIVGGTPLRLKREKSEQERVDSSVQRTKKTIRQRCMAFSVDRLLTLTYKENMQDRRRCYEDTARFIQRCQSVNLIPKYIAVPELQSRGAWHVHIVLRGYMPVRIMRRIWREIVGEYEGKPNGNVNIAYRKRGALAQTPWRLANYLGKYIGKSVEQAAPGERTFWASEWNNLAPVCRTKLLDSGVTLTQVVSLLASLIAHRRQKGELRTVEWWQPRKPTTGPPGYQPPILIWAA